MQLITRPHPHALRRQDLCSCSDKGDQKVAPSKLLPSLRFFASPPAGLGQIGFCGLVILVATVAQQSQVLCNEQSLVPRCHGPNWLSASWAFLPGRLRKLRARRPTQRMLHRGEQEATAYGHRPSGEVEGHKLSLRFLQSIHRDRDQEVTSCHWQGDPDIQVCHVTTGTLAYGRNLKRASV